MALAYKLFGRIRHRRAFDTPEQHGSASDFAAFAAARQCLLVTFKRSGEPVPTPVNFGLAEGKLYFRTEPHVAKVKRIQNQPLVRVCPCNLRGKPTGPFVQAHARALTPGEDAAARAAVAGNWRADMKLAELGMDRVGVPMLYIELTAAATS
jgi:hypothetical protein